MNNLSSSDRELVSESSVKPHHRARESTDTFEIDCRSSGEMFTFLKLIDELFAGKWQEVEHEAKCFNNKYAPSRVFQLQLHSHRHHTYSTISMSEKYSMISMSESTGDTCSSSDPTSGMSPRSTNYRRDQSFYHENVVFLVS